MAKTQNDRNTHDRDITRRDMSLVLFTSETPDAPLRWALVHDGEVEDMGVASSLEGLVQTYPDASDVPVTLVLPGDQIAARMIDTPAKSKAQFRQAAQFALEDVLAAPVEDMHLVVPDDFSSGRNLVIAVPKEWLAQWTEAMAANGLSLSLITADYMLLRSGEGVATLLFDETRVVANIGGTGFVADASFAAAILPELLSEEGVTQAAIFQYGDAPVPNIGQVSPRPIASKEELAALYIKGITNETVDFQQGAFAPAKNWRGAIGPWKIAAGLAACCAGIALIWAAVDGVRAGNAAQGIRTDATVLYQQAFPGERVTNLSAQARRKSGTAATGNASFLALAATLTKSVEALPNITVEEITYRADGTLETRLRFSQDDLDTLKKALSDEGVTATESRNPRLDGNVYVGGLTLRQGR